MRRVLFCALCFCFCAYKSAEAQTVYSVGTQQVYDSNIYLESGKPFTGEVPEDPNGRPFKEFDGDKNDDFISNPYIAVAGRIPFFSEVVANYSARTGFLLYTNNSVENRATADASISLTPEQGVLGQYWTLGLTDVLSSQANSVGVAQNTSARQAQINNVSLSGGLNNYNFTNQDSFSNILSISRQDFLGQFLFGGNNDDERTEMQGVDSFGYAMNSRLNHKISERWSLYLNNNLNYYDVTGGTTNNVGGDTGRNNDRVNDSPSIGFTYFPGQYLQLNASTGVDFSYYTNAQPNRVLDENGEFIDTRDKSQNSFFFGSSAGYTISDRAMAGINIMQSAGTDIDGNRILVRTVAAHGSYIISDRASGNLSAQFNQFDNGDNLNDATDRYEILASVRYSITDAISLSVGYSYSNQNAEGNTPTVLFSNGDYDDHKAFLSIDTGFIGILR